MIWIAGIFLFFFSITLHECGHGYSAYLFGDDTAKRMGRLSLNPLRHIDPVWTLFFPVMLFLATSGRFLFGMAKPVPVNFLKLRPYRTGIVIVALAGIVANLSFAALLSVLLKSFPYKVLLYTIWFNIALAVFNALPIPPLDGSRVVSAFLPRSWILRGRLWEVLSLILIALLYFSGLLSRALIPAINFFCRVYEVPALPGF